MDREADAPVRKRGRRLGADDLVDEAAMEVVVLVGGHEPRQVRAPGRLKPLALAPATALDLEQVGEVGRQLQFEQEADRRQAMIDDRELFADALVDGADQRQRQGDGRSGIRRRRIEVGRLQVRLPELRVRQVQPRLAIRDRGRAEALQRWPLIRSRYRLTKRVSSANTPCAAWGSISPQWSVTMKVLLLLMVRTGWADRDLDGHTATPPRSGAVAARGRRARLPGLRGTVAQRQVPARVGRSAKADLVPGIRVDVVDAGDLAQGHVNPPAPGRQPLPISPGGSPRRTASST